MFERFDDSSRRVVVYAQQEAGVLDSECIGSDHLLLGVLHDEATAATLLPFGVTLDSVRARLPAGNRKRRKSGHIPFSPSAKRVLEGSLREVNLAHADAIEPHHLLLAICADAEGEGCQVLGACGVDAAIVRDRVNELDPPRGSRRRGRPTAVASHSRDAALTAQLAAALIRYGRHEPGCPAGTSDCTCGLQDILDRAREA